MERDVRCQGTNTYDPANNAVTFCPHDGFAAGTSYYAVLTGDATVSRDLEGRFRNYVWQFSTAPLPAPNIRILTTDRATSSTRLCTLHRRGAALLAELRCAIAAAHSAPPPHVGWLAAAAGGAPLASNAAVSRLRDGDEVLFSLRPGGWEPDGPPPPPAGPPLPAMYSEEYRQQHWVNPEAGYFAVCGKMSPETELGLLLALVQAYQDGAGGNDGAGHALAGRGDHGGGDRKSVV